MVGAGGGGRSVGSTLRWWLLILGAMVSVASEEAELVSGTGLWIEGGRRRWMATLEIGSCWLMGCWELLELERLE